MSFYTPGECTPTIFIDDRITMSTIFHWSMPKPSSCYPTHRTLYILDRFFCANTKTK